MGTLCIACLSIAEDMVIMDKSSVDRYNDFTNLDVKHSEDDPLHMCRICFDAVNFCVEFRKKCISSDIELKELMTTKLLIIPKIEENHKLKVKDKIKLEYDSDIPINEDPYFHESNDFDSDTELSVLQKAKLPRLKKSKLTTTHKDRKRKKISKANAESSLNIKIKEEKNIDHIKKEDTIDCGICPKTFDDTEIFMKHLEKHKDGGCDKCYEKFLDVTETIAHRLIYLPEDQKKCHICNRKYISVDSLEYHYIIKHNYRSHDPRIYCKVCRKPFRGSRQIRTHMRSVHRENKYKCSDCNKWCREQSALNSHMLTHRNDKTYKCEKCDFSCKRSQGLKEHINRKHTVGAVMCKICNRVFGNQAHLDAHKCKHALQVVCPVCGITISKSVLLSRHMHKHANKPRYICDRCDASFAHKFNLRIHLNKHDGVRPHRCEYCPMAFYSMSVLIKHRRTHTGERPYKCDICGSRFTGKHNLKVHMKVHGLNLIVKKALMDTV